MDEDLQSSLPPIGEFYAGRHILVTGGTGFIGKVLIEKLLRSCSNISKIYILIRNKRGVSVDDRFKQFLAGKVFERIRDKNAADLEKIVPISSDLFDPNLGISEDDLNMLKNNVSIIFHSAATVKFQEHLRQSIQLNVGGTYRLLQIAQNMPKLVAFVHVSTAYSNCDRKEIGEKIYPVDVDPMKLMDTVEWMDNKIVDTITPGLMGEKPNTYTFTKAMAESVIEQHRKNLPVVIIRPSIVTCALKDPLPGWIDNYNTVTGFIIAYCKGVLRTAYIDLDAICDIIPVDICVNLFIAAAWHCGLTKPKEVVIYNSTSGNVNPFRWKDFEKIREIITRYPSDSIYRCPGGHFARNSFTRFVRSTFDHYIPAFFADVFSKITKIPLFPHGLTALETYRRMDKAVLTFEYFGFHEWQFENKNLEVISHNMNLADTQEFNFNAKFINWGEYMSTYYLGVKQFLLNEDIRDAPKARRNLKIRYWMGCTFQIALFVCLWKLLSTFSTSINELSTCFFETLYELSASLSSLQ